MRLNGLVNQVLLIDLDGVIRHWPKQCQTLEQSLGISEHAIAQIAFNPPLLEPVITGKISDVEWRTLVIERLARIYPVRDAAKAVLQWSLPVGELEQDVLSLLRETKSRRKIILVTNATDRLPADLAQLGIANFFDEIVNSSTLGVAKPSPAIFQKALEIVGATPSEALFVDDSPINVAAATQLGIRSHQFVSTEALRSWLAQNTLLSDTV